MNKHEKCYIYTRVSTEMQVDGYSLDAQTAALKKYAENRGIEICGSYQDAGKSGKSIEGRPEFQRMFRDIASGKDGVDYVLVFKLSRFGRSVVDALNALREMKKYNVNLICTEEGLDTSTSIGRLVFTIMSSICEMERENIRTQTMEGRREKARQGKWNGGLPPYGYTVNANGVLEVIEEEREIVEKIFKLYVEKDWGFGKIAKHLNNIGIVKNTHENAQKLPTWSGSMISNVIDNEVYYGKIRYGKRTIKNIQGEEKRVPVEDYIVADGMHEAIVSEEIWMAAHRKRERIKGRIEKKIGVGRENLLTCILKCPECGSPMYSTRRGRSEEKMLYYYKCGRQLRESGHRCSYTKQYRQEEVNEQVYQAIVGLIDCQQFADEVDARIQKEADIESLEKEIKSAKKALNDTQKNKNSLENELDSLSADTVHYKRKRQDMSRRLDVLYDKLEEQEELLETLQLRKENSEKNRIQKDMVYSFLKNFKALYEKMTDEEKKRFYKLLLERIEIYKEPLENGQIIKSISFQFPIFITEKEILKEGEIYGRGNAGGFIRMTIDVPNMKIIPVRPATYKQIKEYIYEHHGVLVHTCYIAEIKKKCGLKMQRNYNVSKKNTPRKLCTKEKEAYIMEALKHFGMI